MPHAHRLIMKNGKDEQDDPHDMTIGPDHNYKARYVHFIKNTNIVVSRVV